METIQTVETGAYANMEVIQTVKIAMYANRETFQIIQIAMYGTLVQNIFLVRAAESFNQIPANIRSCGALPLFKKKLKQWIGLNIPHGQFHPSAC